MSDVVIAGAGPSGMAAAVAAAAAGVEVMLLDDNPGPGGQIWRGGAPRVKWLRRLLSSGARVISGCRVVAGDASGHTLRIETRDGARTVAYRKLILATGARELYLPFPGWTSPNVVGVGGLQALAKSGFSVAGKRIIVAGSGPLLLAAAAYLTERGAVVPCIAEQTSGRSIMTFARALLRSPRKLLQAAALRMKLRKTRFLFSCWPEKISGNTATLRRGDRAFQERCDYLAVGYGFRPNVELAAALGCAVENACVAVNRLQQTSVPDIYAAGECTGIGGVELASIEGQIAGLAACGQLQAAGTFRRRHASAWQFAGALNQAFRLRPELREVPDGDTIVCRCEDVRWGTLQEMRSRREAKLYTRCGMGPCQARICGPILDFMQSADCDTTRPPVFPARLETFVMDEETQEA